MDERIESGDAAIGAPVSPATLGAAEVHPASSPEIKTLLRLMVGVAVVAALYVAQEVLIPLILAVMLSFVLSPLAKLLRRTGLPRGAAVVVSVIAALGLIGLFGTLVGSQAAALSADAPRYVETIERKVEGLQTFAAARLTSITQQLGVSRFAALSRPPAPAPATRSRDAAGAVPPRAPQPVLVEMARPETTAVSVAGAILAPVLGPLETTFIVLIVSIFILLQQEDLRDRLIRLLGSTDLQRTTLALDDAGQRLSRYFVSQLAVNTTFGIVIGVGLWA